ncbi:hypothetical protein BDA99DRAFT_520737 [Phascolomyces articulosus]|uniref:L domain-like protein n=1 Tax=Phascolomyces articulosus TaxID=60185 RepID=A0AAD5PBU4_9FUNG|nr:hypothetical protein BDA99DRAFT_520737 [Phascolomyces articulosus]
MGQGVSTKKHGQLTFGYLKVDNNKSSTTVTTTILNTTTDLLLDRPEDYGLSTTITPPLDKHDTKDDRHEMESTLSLPPKQPQQQQPKRPDSGYVEDNRLVKELAYIDTTYYLDIMTQSKQPTKISKDNDAMEQQKKLTFGDIIPKESGGQSLQELQLSCRHLTSLNCTNLYYLTMVQKLDLSKNHLTSLPDAIGSLINLTVLQLAHNRLVELPDTICGLVNLTDLDLGHNQLTRLTPYIGHLKKVTHLNLNHNHHLSDLPIEMGGMESLSSLSVLHCPQVTMLPAELLQLPNLRRLKIASANNKNNNNQNNNNNNDQNGNSNNDDGFHITDHLAHNPPSLREICARKNLKEAAYYFPHVKPKPCTACGEPYFESYVPRRRLVERSDSTLVIFEYRLCSAHWTDDNDRIRYVFSHTPPSITSSIEGSVLKFLPPIVNPHHLNTQQHQSSSSTMHQDQRIITNNSTTVEEEKVVTASRWRPQRFLKRGIKH